MLELIPIILFAAFSTAAFSKLFDYAISPGNILGAWYTFLMRKGNALVDPETGEIEHIAWWTMPLGVCIICFNFWAGILPYSLMVYSMEIPTIAGIVFFFSFQGVSFILIKEFQNRYE